MDQAAVFIRPSGQRCCREQQTMKQEANGYIPFFAPGYRSLEKNIEDKQG